VNSAPRCRLVCLVVSAVLIAPTAASATTQTGRSGAVSASFTFRGSFPNYSHERLTITRKGIVAYSKPVSSSHCLGGSCAPGDPERHASSVHVLDLESNGEPDVVLNLFTGGAHCCTLEQIFRFDAAHGAYVKTEHDFGDPGDNIRDLDHNGRLEFVTADDDFAFAFTSFAASGLPLQILTFRTGHFTNVTRHYPKLLTADAAQWLRLFKHHLSDGVGLIAAWAADEDLLGHFALVQNTLASELRKGDLRSPSGGGRKFVSALNRFLRRHGYQH
jgi:hypothetical protein